MLEVARSLIEHSNVIGVTLELCFGGLYKNGPEKEAPGGTSTSLTDPSPASYLNFIGYFAQTFMGMFSCAISVLSSKFFFLRLHVLRLVAFSVN